MRYAFDYSSVPDRSIFKSELGTDSVPIHDNANHFVDIRFDRVASLPDVEYDLAYEIYRQDYVFV